MAPDGKTAKGRWRALVFGGAEGGVSVFGDCIYENEYRKEDGVWKIAHRHLYSTFLANYTKGWARGALPIAGESTERPPLPRERRAGGRRPPPPRRKAV